MFIWASGNGMKYFLTFYTLNNRLLKNTIIWHVDYENNFWLLQWWNNKILSTQFAKLHESILRMEDGGHIS